jgi:hypothetical protein
MSERDKFITDLSQKILAEVISGALSAGKSIDTKAAALLAIKAAAALFDQLCDDGHLGA